MIHKIDTIHEGVEPLGQAQHQISTPPSTRKAIPQMSRASFPRASMLQCSGIPQLKAHGRHQARQTLCKVEAAVASAQGQRPRTAIAHRRRMASDACGAFLDWNLSIRESAGAFRESGPL